MKYLKIYCSILLLCSALSNTFAQQAIKPYPVIGQPCPDFNFTEVANYDKPTASLKNMKGKYFILDFWAKTCSVCIENMPKVNRTQEEYKGKVQIILAGHDDKEGEMRKIYTRLRDKYKMILPCIYDSVAIWQFLPNHAVPLLVWVDTAGIVQAVTASNDLTHENLEKFLAGEKFESADLSYAGSIGRGNLLKEEKERLLNIDDNNRMDLLCRSTLLRCDQYKGPYLVSYDMDDITIKDNIARLVSIKVPLTILYNLAYYGICMIKGPGPLIEVKDSSNFYLNSGRTLVNYSYALQIPKDQAVKENLMGIIQNDLKKCFGYDVHFEDRAMPCYFLSVIDKAKANNLITKQAGEPSGSWAKTVGGKMQNISMEDFCNNLKGDLPSRTTIIDQTGIKEKINIEFKDVNLFDMKGIRSALQKVGLDLIQGKSVMNVLVVKDGQRGSISTAKN